MIIKTYTTQRTTIVKHIHGISPTGHIAHRNNNHAPHECPACLEPYEDNTHLLQCSDPSRDEWRRKTIKRTYEYQQQWTDPYLLDLLKDGLTRLHRQLPGLEARHYPRKYHALIAGQHQIGWDQLYQGRWDQDWIRLQQQYMSPQAESTTTQEAQAWLIGLGRLLINQWLELWTLRNEQRHGSDESH